MQPHVFSFDDAYGCAWMRAIASAAHADSAGMPTGCGCVSQNPERRRRTGLAAGTVRGAVRTACHSQVAGVPGRGRRCSRWMSARSTTLPARSEVLIVSQCGDYPTTQRS